jgi:hypothetical protein
VADRLQTVQEVVDKIPTKRKRPWDLQAEKKTKKIKVKVCRTESMSKKCIRTFEEGH